MTSEPYVLTDPRLDGWTQNTELWVPVGASVKIVAIGEHTQGTIFDRVESLIVRVAVDGEDGTFLFFSREDGKSHAFDDLAGINAWLEEQHESDGLKYDPRSIDPDVPLQFDYHKLDLVAGLAAGLNMCVNELWASHPDIAEKVSGLFNNAIYLGRITREAELKFQHERSAEIGYKVRTKQSVNARVAGDKRSEVSRAWQALCAAWVRSTFIEGILDGAKPTNTAIADFITENWAVRPFTEGPSQCLSHDRLAKILIPSWPLQ